jgi:hypothetical protein
MIASLVAWALLFGFVWLVLQAGKPAYLERVQRELDKKRAKTGL